MTKPNTESDKSIDDLKLTIKGIYNPNDKLLDRYVLLSDEAKSQLLAEILKGAKKYEVEYTGEMRPTSIIQLSGSSLNTMSRIYTKTEQAIPTQYLKELFNVEEK